MDSREKVLQRYLDRVVTLAGDGAYSIPFKVARIYQAKGRINHFVFENEQGVKLLVSPGTTVEVQKGEPDASGADR